MVSEYIYFLNDSTADWRVGSIIRGMSVVTRGLRQA